MARIFRQHYSKTQPDGSKIKRQSGKWYIEYRDAQGIRRRVPGYRDKMATQQYAAELERRAEREQAGLVDIITGTSNTTTASLFRASITSYTARIWSARALSCGSRRPMPTLRSVFPAERHSSTNSLLTCPGSTSLDTM